MLRLQVVLSEGFDDETQKFVDLETADLELRHSLISLSKWESKWKIPFLGDKEKTPEQMFDYIHCMTLNEVSPEVYNFLSQDNINEISEYINDPYTATKISNTDNKTSNREIYTAEIFYYMMVAHHIPFEVQDWHLNRLLTLIQVCNIKSQPEKKRSKKEILAENREINRKRREMHNTTG